MSRTTVRRARRPHRCSCGSPIDRGEYYLEHVCSPDHGDVGNVGWWRLAECATCAVRYGRGRLLPTVEAAR